jgi:hypothetical protein
MAKKKDTVKRTLKFTGPELDLEIELKRVVALDIPKKMFIIEEIKDGEYRLTYSKEFLPDISMLQGMLVIREE